LPSQSGRCTAAPPRTGPAPEVMSWLLDTDVICQPAKRHGDARVIAWLEEEQDRCYTSAVVIAQLAYWVRTKEGRQRQVLQTWLTRLVDALQGRIHGFNVSVAHVWAEQERLLDKGGQRMPVEDSYIAATARVTALRSSRGMTGTSSGPDSRSSIHSRALHRYQPRNFSAGVPFSS